MIIATAGHVDHGKTTLIKALTGTDTDRLPEEKSRGMSIDLGFAYQSMAGAGTLGFVDVPGHEKFIRNMLSGVDGIDLGLLVVAADDGVMPQTREHFAILDLLGIDQCVVALTKIDRVSEDQLEQVKGQVDCLFADAGRVADSMYPVCALDNHGVSALKDELHHRVQGAIQRSATGRFRMAIDRVFSLKGTGLVVTGLVRAGAATLGDNLILSSNGAQVRVRDIRALNKESDIARVGERCAMNIAGRGISEQAVKRGDWLIDEELFRPTRRIDVELRVLESETRSLKHWTPTHLHIGSGHLSARVAVLSGGVIAAGEQGLAQLVLTQDTFALSGDRFVLRDQSAQRTIAGGHVIDPFSPKRGRSRPSRLDELRAMNHGDFGDALIGLAAISEAGVLLNQFSIAHNIPLCQLDTLIDSFALIKAGDDSRRRVFSSRQWDGLLHRIELAINVFHKTHPSRAGASFKDIQLAIKPHFETSILEEACEFLMRGARLERRGTHFHLPSHEIKVSEEDQRLWAEASRYLAPNSGSPLSLHQASEAMGVEKKHLEKSLKAAVKFGEMVLVAKNRYLPRPYMVRQACAAEVLANCSDEGAFSVTEYCKHTQIGRNFAIDLLEYFDRIGLTERQGNSRRMKRSVSVVFSTDVENPRGRGSHPGGAPGLQIQ